MKKTISLALVLVLGLAMAGLAQAGTITVGLGTGYDFDAIRAGIDAASDGDTVLVAPGEYVITEPISFRGKAITVISEAGSNQTTIRMGTPADTNRGSVVIFESNETDASVLEGFTITGGRGSRFWVPSDSVFVWVGGGIFFDASSGTVRNCVIVQNKVEYAGGGVCCAYPCSTTLIDCTIEENSAWGAGGTLAWGGASLTITNCIIRDNSATESAGGVFCWQDSSATMTDCIITGNTAETSTCGGVKCWRSSSLLLTNCVISGNSALTYGGGVECWKDSRMSLINCTITGNSASEGGGVVVARGSSGTITNSIICANTAPKGREIAVVRYGSPLHSTLTVAYSDIAGGQTGISVEDGTFNWGEGNIDADPPFARLGYWDDNGTREPSDDFWVDGDYHLKSQAGRWEPDSQTWVQDDVTSPCIDAGDPMSPIGWELFSNGGFVNMGAYGGTAKASKSYFGEPICETIVAGDINGDGQVNQADLEIMALHWTDDEPWPLP